MCYNMHKYEKINLIIYDSNFWGEKNAISSQYTVPV